MKRHVIVPVDCNDDSCLGCRFLDLGQHMGSGKWPDAGWWCGLFNEQVEEQTTGIPPRRCQKCKDNETRLTTKEDDASDCVVPTK